MSLTGLVLYVVPEGRIAYWTTWELFGLEKTDWGNIHILSSILFIAAGGFHTYFNWKPLMNYFKDKARKGVKLRRELAISSVLSVWIVVGAIWPFPPLSYLLDFNEWVKDSWIVQDAYEPPFGHAELLSLKVFTRKMDIDLIKAVGELKANGVAFENVEETLEEIAEKNSVSPMNIYFLIKKFEPIPEQDWLESYTPEMIEVELAGTGIGNRTFGTMCERLGLDTALALSRLASSDVPVRVDQTLKTVAETVGVEPIELVKVMLLEGYTMLRDE